MTEQPLHEAVEQQLAQAQHNVETAFGRGYQQGRSDQRDEDRYYVERCAELTKLLASAESEIQRLRARAR